MKIKDIMTTDVISVSPEMSISKVADIIFANRFHGLPVAEKGRLVGIITEDDFFLKNYDAMYLPSHIKFVKENKLADNLPDDVKNKIEKLLEMKARDIMTTNCISAKADMDVSELMKTVKETKFTTFPVINEENDLIGIVTLSDILGTVRKGSVEMRKAFQGKIGKRKADELAKELDVLWREELAIVSKRRIRTWKGILLIAIASVVGLAILSWAIISSRNSCEIEQKNIYPIECQKFNYSNWSECKIDGTQTREVLEKLPPKCVGGVPESVRLCQ
jgi:acetoin utilization protein AcuB